MKLSPLCLAAATAILSALAAQAGAPAASGAQAEMRGTALEAGSRRPLAGAVAALHSESDAGLHFLTSSDSSGRFLFQTLPAGVYSLEVTLAGYRSAGKKGLEIRPPFRSIIEMALERGAEAGAERPAADGGAGGPPAQGTGEASGIPFAFTLMDREQKPVPEGIVALVALGGDEPRRSAKTDSGGNVSFEGLQPRRYRLTASAPGFLSVRSERIDLSGVTRARVTVILTPYPLDFAGNLEDLLPFEEPLLPYPLPAPDSEP